MKLSKNIISGKELLAKLNMINWEELIPKLHYYALNKLERYPILQGRYNIENLANQFADDAIELIWNEERKWNLDAYADAYSFLKGVVDSLVSAFIKSPEVRLFEPLPDDDYNLKDVSAENSESNLIAKEIEVNIQCLLKDDKEASEVFACLVDGLKPREISIELKITVNDIYNIIKRVHRKLGELKTKLKAG